VRKQRKGCRKTAWRNATAMEIVKNLQNQDVEPDWNNPYKRTAQVRNEVTMRV